MVDRRYILYFDWISFALMLMLSAIGLLFVYSATYRPTAIFSLFFKKQLFGVISGIIIYLICSSIDYRTFMRWGYFLYFATIALLIVTLIKGSVGMGAQRWVNLGFIKFQPSEITKLYFPAFFTYYFYTEKKQDFSLKVYVPLLALLVFTALLIRKQPDLGTAVIIALSGFTLCWLAGLSRKFFLVIFLLGGLNAPIIWKFLKPYQKQRIAVFFGQGQLHKERYQIEQSKIAVGSGGFWGKGLLKGTQNQLMFLPESRTDFIFSVLCEEWGFSGALLLLSLYMMLFIRACVLIMSYTDFFVQLLAIGLMLPLIISTTINLAMVLDLLPVVGIPLPFISYGITNLWITFASLGFFNSIAVRRFSHARP